MSAGALNPPNTNLIDVQLTRRELDLMIAKLIGEASPAGQLLRERLETYVKLAELGERNQ